jgi:Na+-driven multidrug efflux pump
MWMGLFSNDEHIVRLGTSYLQIAGPIYGFYGLGMALFFVTQGVGSNVWTMIANAVRLLASAVGGLIAVYWLDLGSVGFFIAIAGGFCAYAALATGAMLRVKEPIATSLSGNRTIGSGQDLR